MMTVELNKKDAYFTFLDDLFKDLHALVKKFEQADDSDDPTLYRMLVTLFNLRRYSDDVTESDIEYWMEVMQPLREYLRYWESPNIDAWVASAVTMWKLRMRFARHDGYREDNFDTCASRLPDFSSFYQCEDTRTREERVAELKEQLNDVYPCHRHLRQCPCILDDSDFDFLYEIHDSAKQELDPRNPDRNISQTGEMVFAALRYMDKKLLRIDFFGNADATTAQRSSTATPCSQCMEANTDTRQVA